MPKVVVDLSKFDENRETIKTLLKSYDEILLKNAQKITSHDIKQEIKNFENFRTDLIMLVQAKKDEAFKEKYPENCDDSSSGNEDEQKIKFVTDKYGNILIKPFIPTYTHVELTYSTYGQFKEIKLLGNVFGLPVRYHVEKTNHKISPTTLKLLENLDEILNGNILEEIIKAIEEFIQKIDDACLRPNMIREEEPDISKWKEFGEKYFYPKAVFEKVSDVMLETIDRKTDNMFQELQKYLPSTGEEDSPSLDNLRSSLIEQHEEGKLSVQKKDDAGPQRPQSSEEKSEECVTNEEERKELSDEALELAKKRWEEFQRKHSLACILKELKDCVIPPNFEFCDLFKNLDVNSLYTKLSLLKASGLNSVYDQIIAKIEEDLGASELKEKDRQIKNLKNLVDEEEELLQYLNEKNTNSKDEITAILLDISKQEAKINRIKESLANPLLSESSKRNLNNKLIREEQKKTNLIVKLNRENQIAESLPDRITTLEGNLEINRQELVTLEDQFSEAIERSKFDQEQAALIVGGKNLEAAFAVIKADSKVSSEAYVNAIINSIDSIIPFENLCLLLTQISFSLPNIQIPENLDEIFALLEINFKDAFAGFFEKMALIILDFLLSLFLQILDAILDNLVSSLCSLLDGTIANTLGVAEGWEKLGQDVLNNAAKVATEFLNSSDLSVLITAGVKTPNTSLTAGLESNSVQGISIPVIPQINLQGEGLIDILTSSIIPQPSPLSQWRLSADKKSFVTDPLPPVVDFEQLDKFLTSQAQDMIDNFNNWSTRAIVDSFGQTERNENNRGGQEETPNLLDEQSVILNSLTLEKSVDELKCLIRSCISLMTPSQSISLLTKKADSKTKELVSSLSANCAPSLSQAYPGLDYIPNLIGEIGLASGAEKFEKRINSILESQQNGIQQDSFSPISEGIICERFDNTKSFIRALMSRTIPDTLANEILNEIDNKKIEQFNNIIDSLVGSSQGVLPNRQSQNPSDFYLEVVDKMIENEILSQDPTNQQQDLALEDIGIENNDTALLPSSPEQQNTLSSIVQKEAQKLAEQNSTLNAMFDMVSHSIFNPIKNSFNRDIGNFINVISSTKEIEKNINITEQVKDPSTGEIIEIPSLEMQMLTENKLVPTLKLVFIGTPTSNKEIIIREDYTKDKRYNLSLPFPLENVQRQAREIFSTGESIFSPDNWSIESIMVPRESLLSGVTIGSKTILSNNLGTYQINNREENRIITIDYTDNVPTEENPLYISNGFVEENFATLFADIPAKYKTTRSEVGNKIIASFKEIKNDTIISPNSFTIRQKHGLANDNPFSLMPNIFNINQQQINGVSVENTLQSSQVDPECLKDLTANIINGGSIESINNILPQEGSASEKILMAIPSWDLQEQSDPVNKITTTALDSSGLIFTPYGNYFDFYHNTIESKNIDSRDKQSAFRNFFIERIEKDLGLQNLYVNNNLNIQLSSLQVKMVRDLFEQVVSQVIDNRLLKDFEQETSSDIKATSPERVKLKLIEYLNLTREPTDFEKENNLDPNIMDFEKLKSEFKEIEQKETEEEMTPAQIRGDEDHESKIIKASKHIISVSFLKTCIIDYVLKSIFVYDTMNYREDIVFSDFISKDIGNYCLQEAKRYNLNKDLHRQFTKYYDFLIKNNKIQETQEDKDSFEEWKKTSFYSSLNCSPKMKKIVQMELKKIIKKLKKLTSCGETEEGENTFSKSFIENLETFDVATFYPGSSENPFRGLFSPFDEEREKGYVFLEKYVKIGNFNQNIEQITIKTGSNTVNSDFLSNSVVTFQEFITILTSLQSKGFSLEEIFNCDTNTETLFDEPPKFGLRVSTVLRSSTDKSFINIELGEQQLGHLKSRSYLVESFIEKNENSLVIIDEEVEISNEILQNPTSIEIQNAYNDFYHDLLKKRLYTNSSLKHFINYTLSVETMWKFLSISSFLTHNDQQGRFLFESTKSTLSKIFNSVKYNGDSKRIMESVEDLQKQQKEREDNTGNPLGPALEALKFFYRTPIQLMKGLATVADPNIAIADKIVQGAAMAGSLIGQKVDIPYKVASLALLPGPIPFTGVPPIPPPLTLYNIAFPVGPSFLALEHLLKDLPYYQNQNQGNTGADVDESENPFSCELLPEENETE